MWHAFNPIGQLLSAHVTHVDGDILSAIPAQCFNGYLKCPCDAFAHIPVSGCEYRTRPLFGDMRDIGNNSRIDLINLCSKKKAGTSTGRFDFACAMGPEACAPAE